MRNILRAYVDKVEGFRNESFQDEELMLVINKGMFRLLDDIIDKNHQQGTVRFEWARRLLTKANQSNTVDWDGADKSAADAIFPTSTAVYYLVSAKGEVSISTTSYSRNRTSEACMAVIGYPPTILVDIVKEWSQIEISETGKASDKEENSFYGGDYKNPRAELGSTHITLYRGEKYIIDTVEFSYYKKPATLTNDATSITEWPQSALQKILDYSVEYLRLSIDDPAYKSNLIDFDKRTHTSTLG